MFNNFSRFIETKSINCFSEINENILDLFVKHVSQKSQAYRLLNIGSLKGFLDTGNLEGWFEISTYTLKEYSKGKKYNQGKINYIPDEVLQQLDDNLHFFPEQIQRLVVLMKTLGLRSCEALNMKFDCLRQRRDGNWDIEFVNWKFQEKLDRLPINEYLVSLIIIQCYLRHLNPSMIKHYIELLPNTIKQEMEAFRNKLKIVDITEEEVKQENSETDDYILEWLREKMQPRALSMGFCKRPKLLKPCPHANTCMSCEHFRLNQDDLPVLKQHLARNRQLKTESIKNGYDRQIDIIQQDENQLIKLINSLENNND